MPMLLMMMMMMESRRSRLRELKEQDLSGWLLMRLELVYYSHCPQLWRPTAMYQAESSCKDARALCSLSLSLSPNLWLSLLALTWRARLIRVPERSYCIVRLARLVVVVVVAGDLSGFSLI